MRIRIWGARGSIPAPIRSEDIEDKIFQSILGLPDIDTNDAEAVRGYVNELPPLLCGTAGGNTSCVEIQANGETFIIDAGSGLRELGLKLMEGPCGQGRGTLHLFISHPHWDHIQGFPFFIPAYIPGNRIFIYGFHDLRSVLEDQQRSPFFPAPLSRLPASREFVTLETGRPLSIGTVRVDAIKNPHPGDSYSYRFEDQHSVLVYASDTEYKQLDDVSVEPHIAFFDNADALIFDAQYTLQEAWHTKEDWGHSSAMIGIDLARAAGVKKLILFHHDPTYSDRDLLEIQSTAIAYQAHDTSRPICEVVVAYEGLTFDLTPPGAVSLQLTADGEAAILTPTNIFDERGVDQLAHQLVRLPEHSIIDLSQVETLTTASLKSLIALGQSAKGTPIVLAAPSERVKQVIELTGYADYFAIYHEVEAALAAVQAREALNLPDQVIHDRYQIEQKIAEYQSGTVLKATDTNLNRTVALNLLSPAFSDETIGRFMRHSRQIRALDHPHIVAVFACEQDEDHSFIVEEHFSGQTLQDILVNGDWVEDRGALSADKAMDVARDIAHALEYAHSRGVIHGDLKPQNILLADNTIKLRGFGLGRLEEGRNLLDAPVLFLTASYLAPEQILGQPLDARTDLYALGVVLYQLFTGHLPFQGSVQEVMQAHLNQTPRPPRELNPQISLSLEHLILKLLAKNPNDRYASAQQAWRVSSSLAVRVEDAARQQRSPLVGREQPLKTLQACWEEALVRRGQLAFIVGEPGIGKTSLAQQVAEQNQVSVLLTGRCQELKGSPAYDLFAQVLRAYAATVPPEFSDEQTQQLLGNLTHLVPELRHMLPDFSEPPSLEPKQEQLRLMASLAQFIRQATNERPWLLVLDDLQWADESSLELLRYLGRHLPSMALLIIGIYRDSELEQGHPLVETLGRLSSHPTYRLIRLGRLTEAGVGQILANIWQHAVPTALTKKIFEHTAGNPFYVEEVAQGLVDEGLITLEEGRRRFPILEEIRLPQSVREAVWQRIGHLSHDARALLHRAAVLGQTFSFDDLHEMSGLSEWEVLEHLDIALERQLVQEGPGDAMLHFRHTEFQYVLYADLGQLRRRVLHRQAAEALERRATQDRSATELAHHFHKAGLVDKALHYSMQAARQAEAAYANDTAMMWYNRTLDILDQLEPEEASRFQSLQVSARKSLGGVLALVGRYNQALTQYTSARELFQVETLSTEQAQHLADLCLQTADVYVIRSEYDIALDWLEKGLRYLDENEWTIEMARIHLREAAVYLGQGRIEAAQNKCRQGLAVSSAIDSRDGQQAVAHAYRLLGRISAVYGDLSGAAQFCLESVQAYEQLDDLAGQSEAFNNLGGVYYYQGDWTQASEVMQKSLKIKEEIGDIHGQGLLSNNLALVQLDRGDWDQAASLFIQSQVVWMQIGATKEEANTLSNLAQVHIREQDWSEAENALKRSQSLFSEIGSEENLPELERRWGEFFLKTGALDEALVHTRLSIELALQLDNPLEQAMSSRLLGQVFLARGAYESAEDALRQSLQILGDMDNEYEAARTKLALARLAQESGSSAEARAYLAQAAETFEQLGAQAHLAEARELEQSLWCRRDRAD